MSVSDRRDLAAAITTATLIGIAALPAAPVQAQWSVFDASNFAKNALTAAKAAAMYEQQFKQWQTQLLQYAVQLQNINQIPQSVWDSELGHELATQSQGCTDIACVRAAAGQLSDVYGTAAQTAEEGATLYRQSADFGWNLDKFSQASGMTPEQIFQYEQSRARAGQEAAETHFDTAKHLQDQLASWQQKADANAKAAQKAQGARDALQALAAQAHLQTTQLSSLVDLEAVNAQAQAAKAARDARDRQKGAEAEKNAREAESAFERFLSGGGQ